MAEPEENLLRDYFHNVTTKADELSDTKLDAVIHSGILRGSRRRFSLNRGFTAVLLTALAVALFVIVPWLQSSFEPERAQLPPKSWGEFEVFRPIIKGNISLESALDAGIVQTIGVSSEEKNGYMLTLNGVLADKKSMIALYTFQNMTEKDVHLHGIYLDNAISKTRSNQSAFFTGSEGIWKPGVTRMLVQYMWGEDQKGLKEMVANMSVTPLLSEAMLSSSEKFRTELSIPFTLETDQVEANSRTVMVNRSLNIAGQEILVEQAYIAPTGIYVDIKLYKKGNTMQIYNLISPKINLGKGKNAKVLNVTEHGLGSEEFIFYNDNTNKDSRMTLEVEGMYALEKSKRDLVINTETSTIIKAPDKRLTISDEKTVEKDGVLALTLFTPKEESKDSLSYGLNISDNFVDGAGSGHFMVRPDRFTHYETIGKHRQVEKGSTTTFFYNVGSEKLPQPLTFNLTFYSNSFKETDRLRIR
ncbi:DUF4179 domain-containing protein [Paenibacillus wynnii]|uniref:DUF4179 domain-containing protein n=1 Tax=Paenibacillus wynnii TaxID=268407 RepID=A0A098M3S2_9BACL|nr:DUF4179 domain-containing protein [Paenibacillus wynnii]KGE16676.1 hypothetical protein PWYN_18420 [Paenibacillus wynnii]